MKFLLSSLSTFSLVSLSLVSLLTPSLSAQNLRTGALPRGYEWIEGTSFTHMPFGLTAGVVQQLWARSTVPTSPLVTNMIQKIQVRRDIRGLACPAFWVECELAFSTSPSNARNPSTNFATNRGLDWALVFTRKKLNFPATAAGSIPGPAPWIPAIVLNRPFIYKNSGYNSLLFETKVFSADPVSPGSNFTLDGLSPFSVSLMLPNGKSSAGCKATANGFPLTCSVTGGMTPMGTNFNLSVANTQANAPVLVMLGRTSSSYGMLTLPLDLTPLGATGCHIYTDILIPIAAVATTSGTLAMKLPVPAGIPQSCPFYFQAYSTAATGVNPMGLSASNGAVILSTALVQEGLVYDATSSSATTGAFKRSMGPILGIQFL